MLGGHRGLVRVHGPGRGGRVTVESAGEAPTAGAVALAPWGSPAVPSPPAAHGGGSAKLGVGAGGVATSHPRSWPGTSFLQVPDSPRKPDRLGHLSSSWGPEVGMAREGPWSGSHPQLIHTESRTRHCGPGQQRGLEEGGAVGMFCENSPGKSGLALPGRDRMGRRGRGGLDGHLTIG